MDMLDDMRVLRTAFGAYRSAATAAGFDWPSGTDGYDGRPSELFHRLFEVDSVPEPLVWLHAETSGLGRVFPDGGFLESWRTDPEVAELFANLSLSIGTPFHWRRQIPLFRWDYQVWAYVLAEGHEGEIWRYEIGPDAWGSAVRAATSLSSVLTGWAVAIDAGLVTCDRFNGWLFLGDGAAGIDHLAQHPAALDPVTLPVYLSGEPVLRERQRQCGVDMNCVDDDWAFDRHMELEDAVAAVLAAVDH